MRTIQNSEANECFEPKRPAELQVQAAKNGFSELGSRQGGKEVLTVDAYSGLKKLGKETELVQSKVCQQRNGTPVSRDPAQLVNMD